MNVAPADLRLRPGRSGATVVRLVTDRPLAWHQVLLQRLQRELAPGRVVLQPRPADAAAPRPGLLRCRLVPSLAPLAVSLHSGRSSLAEAAPTPMTIDLSARPQAAPGKPALVPLFDGRPGAEALLAALLAGRSPLLEVCADPEGWIIASGRAGLDDAETLEQAVVAVTTRMADLLAAALRGIAPAPPLPDCVPGGGVRPARPSSVLLLRDAAQRLGRRAVRSGFRLAFQPGHWRIGWRLLNDQDDAWAAGHLGGPAWQELASPAHQFYADPFPISLAGRRHLFFEVFDHRRGKGHIATVAMGPDGPQGPVQTVLDEPWHLSYPFVIEADGAVWMIPESAAQGRVTLYRADPFPTRWVRETDLLCGVEASDSTILWHGDRYWMFSTVRGGAGSWSDMLCLHMAPRLTGPWRPHPANPVLICGATARPAGAITLREGRLCRPVQDCRQLYGAALGLAEITRLDEGGFAQRLHAMLRPGGPWPGRRLHMHNRDGAFEVIDGSARVLRRPWGNGRPPV